MRLLVDTNIVIAHEDDDPDAPHVNARSVGALVELSRALGFELLTSHGTRSDFARAAEPYRAARMRALRKYYAVLEPVPTSPIVRKHFPSSLTPQNRADLEVLSSFATGAATALVTEDRAMRSRARDAGLTGVFSLDEALEWLRGLRDPTLINAAAAHMTHAYQIDRSAQIFRSLNADYPDFDTWWMTKVVPERRPVIVLGEADAPNGIAVMKEEEDVLGIAGRVLKICTFKIGDELGGSRRGELLLRAVVDYATQRSYEVTYLTVLPHHDQLIGWLGRFGFRRRAGITDGGEIVMVKRFVPEDTAPALGPLAHHVEYGPRSLIVERVFLIPIQASFHSLLLPDGDDQQSLLENMACGNAIRKAYLCHSNNRQLRPGDTLVFLRTGRGPAEATAVGVVEDILVSDRPDLIAAFVGGRTVYSYGEIQRQCHKEVLTVLFRFDRRIDPVWSRDVLVNAGVMVSTPMSITSVPEAGTTWVRSQLTR